MPHSTAQPLLLFAYNQPDDGLLNDEFWWLTLNKPYDVLYQEIEALLAAGIEWRRQLEASAESGVTIFDIEEVQSVPISLHIWCVAAADDLTAVRTVAHGLGRRGIAPNWILTESLQVASTTLDMISGKMFCQPLFDV
ncbi:hypothetical protein [Paraburkholderia sp. GAS42]|uniref:hypothetical protein n=1 Tax=Paraburkholderia sp. GAS42 TaxID=3035135 RepID=UPI003D25648A